MFFVRDLDGSAEGVDFVMAVWHDYAAIVNADFPRILPTFFLSRSDIATSKKIPMNIRKRPTMLIVRNLLTVRGFGFRIMFSDTSQSDPYFLQFFCLMERKESSIFLFTSFYAHFVRK